jgi:RNA polymerase sigma-70 factor (ECF subfamily)
MSFSPVGSHMISQLPGPIETQRREEADAVAAARAGDHSAFSQLVESHRRELQVHCYRMLGSFEDSEDLVQETFLRAWRNRATFHSPGRSSFRAWLYRIATNACLDALNSKPRRVLPSQLGPPGSPPLPVLPAADLPWLQPYPDHLLEGIAPPDEEPEAAVVARETIEIAFLAAIQLLSARQRAALIVRDVLGWSAKDTALLLETSVASVNSALQRARATLRDHLPGRRLEWAPSSDPSEDERAVLQRFMDAHEKADIAAFTELLREDTRATMPPTPTWHEGREAIVWAAAQGLAPGSPDYMGRWRLVPTRANMQPAAAAYLRRPGDSEYRAFALDVLRVEDGKVAEITSFIQPGVETGEFRVDFGWDLFGAFGFPPTIR